MRGFEAFWDHCPDRSMEKPWDWAGYRDLGLFRLHHFVVSWPCYQLVCAIWTIYINVCGYIQHRYMDILMTGTWLYNMGSNHGKEHRPWNYTSLGSDGKLCNLRKVTAPTSLGRFNEIICLKSWHWSMAHSKCSINVTVKITYVSSCKHVCACA